MNFQNPGWLALLILLPLLGVAAVLAVRLRRRQWTSFVAPRLRPALLRRTSALPRWVALVFLLLACAATIVALARPRADAGTRVEKTMGRNVMIALDISKSMRVDDVKPDRLTQAKVLIYELLDALPSERIGMIAFAGDAYVYAPLTVDHSAVREIVEQIDENWAPLGGSDIGAAVELATDRLKETGQHNNALVILSDGERNTGGLDDRIAEAERAGVTIVAIGVGTEDGGFVPNPLAAAGRMVDRSGRVVISQLKTEVLRKLAEGTNGRFMAAGAGGDVSALVKSVVKDLDAFEMDGRERRVSIEFYQWLMLPAIVFLMASIALATRWKGVRLALLAAGLPMMVSPPAKAGEAAAAKAALTGERYEQARDRYRRLAEDAVFEERRARYRLGEATAAYRAGNFRDARAAYSRAIFSKDDQVRATAHTGLGNALFQLGWLELTGESYPTGEGATPDLDTFDAVVKEQLAKLSAADVPLDGEPGGFSLFESLITNWTDAVRHYESARKLTPGDPVPARDRDMTMVYLKRLQELLNEEKDQAEQSMPQEQPGEGQPQQGPGEMPRDGERREGEGGEPQDQDGEGGEGEEPRDGRGDEGEPEDQDGKGDDEGEDGEGTNPNESPEERARRLLKENADLEKGPLSPGRREFRDPEKDW